MLGPIEIEVIRNALTAAAAEMDITVWRKFVAENKVDTKAVDVFYSTPPYFNYNWAVHADMPADLRGKLQKALTEAPSKRTPKPPADDSNSWLSQSWLGHLVGKIKKNETT